MISASKEKQNDATEFIEASENFDELPNSIFTEAPVLGKSKFFIFHFRFFEILCFTSTV